MFFNTIDSHLEIRWKQYNANYHSKCAKYRLYFLLISLMNVMPMNCMIAPNLWVQSQFCDQEKKTRKSWPTNIEINNNIQEVVRNTHFHCTYITIVRHVCIKNNTLFCIVSSLSRAFVNFSLVCFEMLSKYTSWIRE